MVHAFITFALAFCALLTLLVAVAALGLNHRSALNRAVAANAFMLGLWALGAGLLSQATTSEQAWWAYRVASIGSIMNPPFILWFFLSFSDTPLPRKLLTAFPFFLVNVSLLVATWTGHLWYSDFVLTAHGMTGVPTNPGAWAMFYVIAAVYLWSFYFFCSTAGYSSARLSWLGRRFRTMVFVGAGLYVGLLVVEATFGWPDFSGLAYALACGLWLYQIYRYGFLGKHTPLPALDHVLSLDVPLALVDRAGTVQRVNAAFTRLTHMPANESLGHPAALWWADGDAVKKALDEALSRRGEVSLRAVTKAERPLWLTVSPVTDEFGDVTGLTLLARPELPEAPLPQYGLSAKESQIAILVAQGRSTREIATQLFIAAATVRVHVFHILEKTGARNRDELIRLLGSGA